MTRVSTHAWFNGEIAQRESGAPSIASISFHLGTGVFDGLMAYWDGDHYYCHRAEEHLVRFRDGAQRMGMKLPWSIGQLMQGIHDLLATEPHATQYVRPIVYRRAPELWITGSEGKPVDVSIFTVKVDREIGTALTCHISPVEDLRPRHTAELRAQDVRRLDGAFLCSTLMEIRPLSCIGDHLLRTTELPAYRKLAETFSG